MLPDRVYVRSHVQARQSDVRHLGLEQLNLRPHAAQHDCCDTARRSCGFIRHAPRISSFVRYFRLDKSVFRGPTE